MDKKTISIRLFMKTGDPQPKPWTQIPLTSTLLAITPNNRLCATGIFPPT
jgi:hypothetical protein